MNLKAKKRSDKIREIEEDIDEVRCLITNDNYLRRLESQEKHYLCDYVLDLEFEHKRLTGRYHILRQSKDDEEN